MFIPFFEGENTAEACGENFDYEEHYLSGPSNDDRDFLVMISNATGNFNLKAYVIDGSNIVSYDIKGASSLKVYKRCGY